jgi:hypothetical protein
MKTLELNNMRRSSTRSTLPIAGLIYDAPGGPPRQPAGASFCFGRRHCDGMIELGPAPPGEDMDEPFTAAAATP